MRGTVHPRPQVVGQVRFIPARAGNGRTVIGRSIFYPVHPRACGERYAGFGYLEAGNGSSPRVRGTAEELDAKIAAHRFIPARAGNGLLTPSRPALTAVHPRACGERASSHTHSFDPAGSSPRVRGTAQHYRARDFSTRFIPARAGNGAISATTVQAPSVHPRACGERLLRTDTLSRSRGSSPRVRGTGPNASIHIKLLRFIPAPAGNGSYRPESTFYPPVHPRACGERVAVETIISDSIGSSPRLRGTVLYRPLDLTCQRFIPAPAGNGRSAHGALRRRTVHPRACGEREPDQTFEVVIDGSSPRLRGTV